MQPYNPTPDRSGEFLSQGINQAAQGISQGFTLNAMQHLATQGSLAAMQPAVDAGIIKQSDLDKIQSMHPYAQNGAVNTLHQLIPQIAINNYRKSLTDIRQQNADTRASSGALTTF